MIVFCLLKIQPKPAQSHGLCRTSAGEWSYERLAREMNPRAYTVIHCVTAAGWAWHAVGQSRYEVESFYKVGVAQIATALYRVVAQYKVDQHNQFDHQRSFLIH